MFIFIDAFFFLFLFFAKVNLEAMASLCAILFSCACVFVHIGSIL